MKAKPQAILLLAIPILIVLTPLSSCVFQSLKSDEIEQNTGQDGFYNQYMSALGDMQNKWEQDKPLTGGNDRNSLLGIRKEYRSDLQSNKKAISKDIEATDKNFEGYITDDNEFYTDDAANFATVYPVAMEGRDGLNGLQKTVTYTEGGRGYTFFKDEANSNDLSELFIERVPTSELYDTDAKKMAQKKLWLQQRILYTMLKPSHRDKNHALVMKLLEYGGSRYAIKIDIPQEKTTTTRRGKQEPKAEYNIINVYFSVIVDSRDLEQFIKELQSYTPHNPNDDSTIPLGIRDKDDTYKKFVRYLDTDGKNDPILGLEVHVVHYDIETMPNAPIAEKTENETTEPIRSDMKEDKRNRELEKINEKLNRPIKVSFRVEVYDYNIED